MSASTHQKDTTLAGSPEDCPVEAALACVGGKWRMMVMFRLSAGAMRFNALQRSLPPITQKVLTATLRGLEADGLVWRRSAGTVPPKVDYGLTEHGARLIPVFEALARWHLGKGVEDTRDVTPDQAG